MNQKGFTLIELVIVIVILGILSVTATTKFVNLQRDARISALQGLKGEMVGAMNQLHPKTILARMDTQASGAITIEGDTIEIVYGYPRADAANAWNQLINQTFVDSIFDSHISSDWYFHNNRTPDTNGLYYIRFMHKSKKYSQDNCYVKYTEAADENTLPIFELVNTGC
ncbi:type II secretion system protein [Aliivibrio salmonicida]|uniref:type II secretion system protein n=1 Tax=Aliivibrio salmonicida TaxID=40269 RepID=UPI00406C2733